MAAISYVPTRFADVDAFSEWEIGLGWEIESTQLSAGSGGVAFDHIAFPELLVGRFASHGAMHNHFMVPSSMLVLLVCRRMLPVFWSGQELQPDFIPVLRSGSEHVSRIPAGWDSYEFMITEGLARRRELLPAWLLEPNLRVEDSWLRAPLPELTRFVRLLDVIFDSPRHGSRSGRHDRIVNGLRALTSASGGPGDIEPPRTTRRHDLVRTAESLMRQRVGDGATVEELCNEMGVSYRVLAYAFQDAYGMSPGRVFRSLRLGRARRLLQTTDLTVTAAASAVGMYELGRFSGQYLRHFGELPSSTRSR